MRKTRPTKRFDKDYKRVQRGVYRLVIAQDLPAVIALLAQDISLPARFRDHALTGEYADHRDCHIRPDLVLIYRKPDAETLELVRLGSHSELEL